MIISGSFRQNKILFMVLALLILVSHQLVFLNWTCDDAFISFRYAENFVNGKGLVFNPGERVEGFSNFLWVLVLSFTKLLNIPVLWTAKFISFIFSVMLVIMVYKTAECFGLNSVSASLCTLFISFSTSVAYYAMSGLETVGYSLLILLSVYFNSRLEVAPSTSLWIALYGTLLAISLTRPEGPLFFLIALVHHLSKRVFFKERGEWRRILGIPVSFGALYLFYLGFRYIYFKDVLPNTFYAKPGGTFVEYGTNALLSNFLNSFMSGSFFILVLPAVLLVNKGREKYVFPLMICGGQVLFMTYSGDWMAFGRFFLPILPVSVCLIFVIVEHLPSANKKSRRVRAPVVIATTLLIAFASMNIYQTGRAVRDKDIYPYFVMHASYLKELGQWMREKLPVNTSIALRRQGAVPYYSCMRSIDLLGLTDREIARIISNVDDNVLRNELIIEQVLLNKPDIIILFPSKSNFEGYMFNKNRPRDRLVYIEFSLYEKALQQGYRELMEFALGSTEKALLIGI